MTQIKHVTSKEMTRRTGVRNALGYTFPEKDLILLKKGLKGKQKREVLDHEIDHLKKGEEGPFLGGILGAAGIGALGNIFGSNAQAQGQKDAANILNQQNAVARADLEPYREFGYDQLGELNNWLSSDAGQFQAPTMEEVTGSAGYDTRLGAVENSAAAKGSLFSGNALRNVGEFAASEYDSTYNRKQNKYQNELNNRLGLVNMGYGAAGGSSSLAQGLGQNLAGINMNQGQTKSNMFSNIAGDVAGGIGAYQGQKNWNNYLDRIKS